MASRVLGGAVSPDVLAGVVREALDFPLPIRPLTHRIRILDLSCGPTLAFKDVGARFMARLMARLRPSPSGPLTVLTATSGDTGGAVAHAFLGLPGIRVVVLFPDGQVTPRQERQFSTLGENVTAVAVQGDFDDCQRMAKEAFGDAALRETVSLTSANSINLGRFLPQTFYYAYLWGKLAGGAEGTAPGNPEPPPILCSVPSGNFGNLAAGLLARAMGLPGMEFLAATNTNDTVPVFLRTGIYRPKPSRRTLSTAMDVGNPSNLARILHLYRGDLNRLRAHLSGRSISDDETRAAIVDVHDRTGHIPDPHTAVAFAALEKSLKDRSDSAGVVLGTAHPAKFAEVVEPLLGRVLPIPPALARGLDAERKVIHLPPDGGALKELLLASESGA
jgi:threonine synthase